MNNFTLTIGSSQPSPTMSRRTSVDHGAILSHGNVEQVKKCKETFNQEFVN
jgi:hypothetical protein